MNILYIGSGFVGACSAAISAASGHNVLVYDIDENKVKMLGSGDRDTVEACLFEDGLGDLLVRNKERIEFTLDYNKVETFLDTCDGIFMCLPTPEIGETGESNLTYYFDAAEKLSQALVKRNKGIQEKYIVIINKSTVPIDMVNKTQEIMDAAGVKNYGVVSNPEFLVEGKAIEGSLRPDRVVVGAWKEKDFEIMRRMYQRFYDSPTVTYIEVNPKEAAAGKLLANFTLFNKLAICFDVVGRTCETFDDLNYESLRKVLATDPRIGTWGLYDSLYAGGSCFIKDSRSLSHQLQTAGQGATLVSETHLANKRQLEMFIGRAEKEAGFDWTNKKVALIGTAFKRDTNDIRNSPSIDIGHFLKEKQVEEVHIYDPAAMDNFKLVFEENDQFIYHSHEFEAIKDCDVIIIATDWPQFRGLADAIIPELKKEKPLIMDGRRMLQHRYNDLREAGFEVIAVGSPFIKGKK
ncbi:UDP-glucose/GDP-mannose dehydrogenase family protein [Candidatus Parcubacteria bacterium]|jgi:UDPglucose 6-dehydrogenase|nr:UDP-glucose/GDP-mannose dehydrogenase family protein [Candidatus Parcubacteria bacterium]MBT3948948.1 UDP-glucose/GDP-mannose dehydrogenase family protein [Candidatus Parcubacteria bacterium]